jgi:tight adherence protein C
MNAIRYEIIIPLLTFFSVTAIGSSILVSWQHKRKMLAMKLQGSAWPEAGKEGTRKKSPLLRFLEKVGNFASHGHASMDLWEQLIRAGYLSSSAPAVYTGVKMVLFLIGFVGTAALILPLKAYFVTKITLSFLGGVTLFFVPNVVLLVQLKKRHDEMYRHLPEAVDLLEICVSSGMGMDMAWNIVADEIQLVCPTLASAMALTNFEIHLGASRTEAMRHMAARTGVDELSSLAAILIQTERFGTSIAATLRVFAAAMREERSFTAQENAEKMSVRLLFPMVLLIFPSVLITAVGPAIIALYAVLK